MKQVVLIAADNFRPEGALRPARAGEVIYPSAVLGRKLVAQGLAIPAKRAPEFAVRTPKEVR